MSPIPVANTELPTQPRVVLSSSNRPPQFFPIRRPQKGQNSTPLVPPPVKTGNRELDALQDSNRKRGLVIDADDHQPLAKRTRLSSVSVSSILLTSLSLHGAFSSVPPSFLIPLIPSITTLQLNVSVTLTLSICRSGSPRLPNQHPPRKPTSSLQRSLKLRQKPEEFLVILLTFLPLSTVFKNERELVKPNTRTWPNWLTATAKTSTTFVDVVTPSTSNVPMWCARTA